MGISTSYLNRKLSAIVNASSGRLIKILRMHYAAVLLRETRHSIKEIGTQVGYLEQANFSRSFFKFSNLSPRDYRSLNKSKNLGLPQRIAWPMQPEDVSYIRQMILDSPWLALVMNKILTQIDKESFGAIQLAEELNLSISQLNRKLKRMLQLPSARLIRYIRLQHAAELLVYDREPLASIAYRTGFFDHSHFCRSFKSLYNCSPKTYRKRHAKHIHSNSSVEIRSNAQN